MSTWHWPPSSEIEWAAFVARFSSTSFSKTDAQTLAFVQQHRLARLSMWSANRDQSCGPNYPDVKVVSDVCSGIQQQPGAFGVLDSERADVEYESFKGHKLDRKMAELLRRY